MKNLQSLIDELINSESGVEVVMDGDDYLGAIADMVFSPEANQIAFKLLGPWAAMCYDRAWMFTIKTQTVQKAKYRIVFESTGGHIYVVQPAQSSNASSTLAHFELTPEQKKSTREFLKSYLNME